MEAFPFDPVNGPKLMCMLGFERTHYPEHWEDVGDAENGPRLEGHPAFDEWSRDNFVVVVVDGKVVGSFFNPPEPK